MKTIDERRRERAQWTDERLTNDLANAAAGERSSLIELLLDLVEFDHRSLSQKGAYHTLFDYCTRKLGYSSSEAGRRIAVARKSEKFPLLLEMIERGELHLSGAAMLAGLLTPENHEKVLRRALGRSQDEIALMVAALAPKPAPKDSVRALRAPAEAAGLPAAASAAVRLSSAEISAAVSSASVAIPAASVAMPAAAPAASAAIPVVPYQTAAAPAPRREQPAIPAEDACPDLFGKPAEPAPQEAAEETYVISFSATKETRDLLERAKEVLRHRFPKARIDEIVNLALKKLLAEVDRDLRKPRRTGRAAPAGAKRGRHIPEAVKQESWDRDGGVCAYVAPDGTRCTSRAWLEFDHMVPYALGGSSTDAANIRPYCRPHNAWAARQIFGPWQGGKMKPQNTS